MHISIATRGKTCTHIQCYDFANYFYFTRKNTKYKGPVCNHADTSPVNLVINWFVAGALQDNKGSDEIEVSIDGSITPVENIRSTVKLAGSNLDVVHDNARGN